jgi:hypothetical protein
VRLAGAYLTVAVASGCTLVLELVAGRVLAPFVGVSIQTWTSIIAVVLAGISLGNYAGGVLADRTRSDRVVGALLAAGGLASLAVIPLTAGAGSLAPRSLPFVLRIVLLTTLLFFVPCLVLGTIPPVAIKRVLTGLERSGKVVGRMYAASTAGSLAGAFLTGFVLIDPPISSRRRRPPGRRCPSRESRALGAGGTEAALGSTATPGSA